LILLAALLLIDPVTALDAVLQASTSATAVLQKHCATPIRAEVERGVQRESSQEVRTLLEAGPDITLSYRLVQLKCGDIVYSRAQNWYRPDRLGVEMNAALVSSDTPFGVVIRPLQPTRKTLTSERPVEKGAVLRHRTVVLSGEGVPLAVVIETYAPELLFALPQ
jgi:chorismate-pyruvate lyase